MNINNSKATKIILNLIFIMVAISVAGRILPGDALPSSLIIAWSLFFGALNTHQRQLTRSSDATLGYQLALKASFSFGGLVGLGLLVYYFIQVAWFWPFVLFMIGGLASALFFSTLDVTIGTTGTSLISFICWPASAVWVFLIVSRLHS